MGNPITPVQNVTAPRSAKRSRKPTKPPSAGRLLLHFAQRHPFICLFAVWSSFLFFGWLAVSGLTYTNPAPLEVVESPQPVVESPANSADSSSAIGLLAIVVATCATSSVLISRRLRSAQQTSRRIIKQQAALSPTSERRASRSQPSARGRQSGGQSISVKSASPAHYAATAAKTSTRSPALTLLPDKTPLESNPPLSLAERLDIRQQDGTSKRIQSNR
ncbi:hypothetical protein NC981_17720 [Leptolyngbya sp. DQ-M1]|uniref:hypothetical protein n=1 Tax=Leptolyngbya sp. DQ-M1 TaxID=2933920 RepID=UPI0032967E03